MPALEWATLSNSTIPLNFIPELPAGGGTEPIRAVFGYCTAMFDTTRSRICWVRCGGHGDYAGNQVFGRNMIAGDWTLMRPHSTSYVPIPGPGPTGNPESAYTPVYSDGSPSSMHTYDGVCYMPSVDKYWSAGGIYWSRVGSSSNSTFLFNPSTGAWEDIPDRPGGSTCLSVWDPVTERVLFHTTGGFFAYNPALNTYTTLYTTSSAVVGSETSTLALDSVNRKVYFVNKHSVAPFRIKMIDLNNLGAKVQNIDVGGDTEIGNITGLGLIYDSDRLVAYGRNDAGTAGTLYVIDPTEGARTWTQLTTTGSVPVPATNGTWKSFFKYNGKYHVTKFTGIYEISPDGAQVPDPVQIAVASGLDIDFTLAAAPPTPPTEPGGDNPIPVNTWTRVPDPGATAPLSVRNGKHHRMAWDSLRGRFLIAGGDRFTSSSGQPAIHTYDAQTGTSSLISPECVLAPNYMPNFPDNVGWVYDSRRDRFLMFRGFYFTDRFNRVPAMTLTPSATTGSAITLTAGSTIFERWMTTATWGPSNDVHIGLVAQHRSVKQFSPGEGDSGVRAATILGEAVITSVGSTTASTSCTASVNIPFASAGPIASGYWVIQSFHLGRASWNCGRNPLAGDDAVLNGDCIFYPTTNTWGPPTWPRPPYGLGNDAGGPSQAAYDEETDSVFLVKRDVGLAILHLDTNTWEVVAFGGGMPAGAEKTMVQAAQNQSYRSQIRIANGYVYFMSNRGSQLQCIVRFHIATKTWNGYGVPQSPLYVGIPDDTEPQLVYDPISHVMLHPHATNLNFPITKLYIFDVANATWLATRGDFPTATDQGPKSGYSVWSPMTQSLMVGPRSTQGVSGQFMWHYRYATT